MAILGHVSGQSHHHSHIETGPHSDGECGQEECPAGGGAGQAEVPFGDGLAGLGRQKGWYKATSPRPTKQPSPPGPSHPAGECQVLQLREVAREAAPRPLDTYPLGEVEGSNAQRPETAEHREEGEPQVVPGRQGDKDVFAFTLC